MSDPLKIPQLVVQVSKPARADESRATPDPIQAPASAAPSFASVLKAKSQPTDSEAKDSDSGQTVATDTIDAAAGLVAAMFAGDKSTMRPIFDALMVQLGYDPSYTTAETHTPAGIGNTACAAVLAYRHADGSNQLGNLHPGAYSDYTGYAPVNTPTTPGIFLALDVSMLLIAACAWGLRTK